MTLAQKKLISLGFLVAALIAAILCKGDVLGKLWIALVLLGLALNILWVRCPHCGCLLGRYSGEFCVMCGEKIDWNAKGGKKNAGKEEGCAEAEDAEAVIAEETAEDSSCDEETVKE